MEQSQPSFSTQLLIQWSKGRALNQNKNESRLSGLFYDSRQKLQNGVFICIVGERVDGHDFIGGAVASGAAVVIGSKLQKLEESAKKYPQVCFIVVDDSLSALQHIATAYRAQFTIPVIGVAGSTGKTTTKDLLGGILNAASPALWTVGSLNNHWGVPQTVMNLRTTHRAAAFELGMNHFDEITPLCDICKPTAGLITNIGQEHLEFLKDEEGVLKANRELFDWLLKNEKKPTLIFNSDNPWLMKLYHEISNLKSSARLWTVSEHDPKANFYIKKMETCGVSENFGSRFVFATPQGEISGVLPLPGQHNLMNALMATAAALSCDFVTPRHVIEGLRQPKISKLRSHVFQLKNGTVIYDDSYNANPTSFAALFSTIERIKTAGHVKKVYGVVSDMAELGDEKERFHRDMGVLARSSGVHQLMIEGKFASSWAQGFGNSSKSSSSREALLKEIESLIQKADGDSLFFFKASNSSRVYEIVEHVKKKFGLLS